MSVNVQDSAFGQLVRYCTRGRLFAQPEHQSDFVLPWKRLPEDVDDEKVLEAAAIAGERPPHDHRSNLNLESDNNTPSSPDEDVEQQFPVERERSRVLQPQKTPDGIILIDWYTNDDKANPQNWTSRQKLIATVIINLYTFGVYSSSAIITPAHNEIMERFNVSYAEASLGLAMYVIGYGIGPLLFSPLQELPALGRNSVYVITYALFVILSVPTALVDNFAGLVVLRFLTGFLGSPCLATGAASQSDMYSMADIPFALIGWTGSAFAGPALGPLISGFAVPAKNWRWSLWPILWLNGPICLAMIFLLPETLGANILYRRARRLRKFTGNDKLRSQSEIDQSNMTVSTIVSNQLIKPFEITFKDPAVFFINLYTAYVYGIYYSFFEAFPLAYVDVYHFNIGETSLTFLALAVGCVLGIVVFACFLKFYALPLAAKNGPGENEDRLIPALLMSMLLPAGMFWWGWTANTPDIHWIVGLIGVVMFTFGAFCMMQCIFVYLPMSYPIYAASLFAANDFFRSAMAGGAIIFAHPLYQNLGIGRGISIMGGLAVGGVLGIWALWYWGKDLRAKSKFAVQS